MKLDDLRARLRADKRAITKPKERPKPKRRYRCSKCRKPREPANLTDPDVAEIIRESSGTRPTHAYRCRECRIIWLACPVVGAK
jgi:hypothetical protein